MNVKEFTLFFVFAALMLIFMFRYFYKRKDWALVFFIAFTLFLVGICLWDIIPKYINSLMQ